MSVKLGSLNLRVKIAKIFGGLFKDAPSVTSTRVKKHENKSRHTLPIGAR
jgi:hypothetical protein